MSLLVAGKVRARVTHGRFRELDYSNEPGQYVSTSDSSSGAATTR